ncbi:iron ABC transporter permease [Halomonas almeriensis]|uniref:FecCD family ABC transporter permease n=1 Tax=Halomonas almeriensis TaxID=308163 RepID=UPI0025B612D0|nr:iron ABC transporter permease [Halomonas almeriensis]MDN3552693.1 iron ABC transporter permease [Halomonas almeriensis]
MPPLVWLLLAALLSQGLALVLGSVAIPLDALGAVLAGGGESLHRTLVLELRLPRALAAFGTGGLLALAGALMQVLLRNPLADPYVLGLSGGASVAALLAMLAGFGTSLVAGSSFAGALASTLIVFGLAHGTGSWTPTRMLLTGVVMAAGWGALISFLLTVSPVEQLPGMLYWLMGDLAYADSPWPVLGVAAASLLVMLPLGRTLNVLARGGLQAAVLGVNVRRMEWLLYLLASLLTAVAVTTAGSIGFVGLMVPHMLRLKLGNDQRLILPASLLAGGTLLTLADTLARTMVAPQQLPVGVITALLGVPSFLYLLYRSR